MGWFKCSQSCQSTGWESNERLLFYAANVINPNNPEKSQGMLVRLFLHFSFALGCIWGIDWGKWFYSWKLLSWLEMGPSPPVFRFLSYDLPSLCHLPGFWSFKVWTAISFLAQCSSWMSSALQTLKDKISFTNTLLENGFMCFWVCLIILCAK